MENKANGTLMPLEIIQAERAVVYHSQLTAYRVTISQIRTHGPFDHSAMDVAGPFGIHFEKETYKRWMLVIRCCTVGAVHLEMLDSMSTSSFLMVVERFIALQPRPNVFFADNGTNFRGGETGLNREAKKVKDQIDILEAQRKLNIKFRFAPPHAPHFMGLVERIPGPAKATLRPALRTAALTAEEMRTVIGKTKGILNNFPIAYMVKSDSNFYYRPLTANHFLLGQPYAELQEQEH
jgi:hypothetical protein